MRGGIASDSKRIRRGQGCLTEEKSRVLQGGFVQASGRGRRAKMSKDDRFGGFASRNTR
jgi:hypothetical protein